MNTKMKSICTKVLAIAIVATSIFGCNNADYNERVSIEHISEASEEIYIADQKADAANPFAQQETIKSPANLKIIKTATTRYKVNDVKKATAAIKNMAANHGAYISELSFNNTLYEKQNKFTIKVPNTYFDKMMDTLASTASFVEYENISTQDVTEEFMDITARLKTKQEVKKRIEEVLRKRAVTVEDILLTEDKLRVIQEEIEAAQGRLKYLNDKVSYSTIHVDLYETVEYKEQPESYTKTFIDKAKNGFSNGWSIVEAIVLGLITIWPFLLMGGLFWFIVRRYVKKKKS